jgi:hypothetical protein
MKERCLNARCKDYHRYGAVGVRIYAAWVASFQAFYDYLGPRPAGTTLDRYPNNDGNYEPGNVRWATQKEQTRNLRTNRLLTHGGKTQCLAAWCEELGLPYNVAYMRIRSGWDTAQVISPYRPRLTLDSAREVKRLVDAGCECASIAERYGVSRATVYAVAAGRSKWGAL